MGDLDEQPIMQGEKKRKKRRAPEYSLRDLMTALMVCHNVTPVYNDEGDREF